MNVKKLIPPIFIDAVQKIARLQRKKYRIGKHEINIPSNLALPDIQKEFRLYDRFLPVLAANLPGDQTIVDIGANIGDTTIAMLEKCDNPIICLEPSDIFFPYLQQNINLLPPAEKARVRIIKKFVGTGKLSGELIHSEGGTANIVVTENREAPTHTPLDTILSGENKIILIKVDTDGFDFDVLRSASEILSTSEPILFWENQIDEDYQMKGFEQLYRMLSEKGYHHFYVFDNFGNLLLQATDFNILSDINTYIFSMKQKGIARTLNYTDILATTEKNLATVEKAIMDYKKNWINRS